MKLIDNVNNRLDDDLKQELKKGTKLSIAAASFSIYAFEALKKELKNIDELKFIFTSPTFLEEKLQKQSREFYIPHIYREADLCGGEFELRLKSELNQRAIAKECSNWVKDKVTFKSNKFTSTPLNGLIHLENEKDGVSYTNVNGFTTSDLGISQKEGFPTLIQKNEYPDSNAYLEWFNQIWKNQDDLEDVTKHVQEYFENAYKENSPDFIYFITLYNIFNDFLDDLSIDTLPNEETGFKDTEVWRMLYNFQKDAVIGAINKLEKYNGCIIADSVGLGKTFSALGVIKYYEKRNKDVLVLCPKKLEANWNTFRHNDKDNILAKDRFGYDVLFHTDMSRDKGMSNGRDLEKVNWGNYGLIVIDESHNFRNNNTVVDKENRYQKLLRRVIKEGIETKVLMLSATPVNNRFNDLKNQLALAYEGVPEKLDEKLNTNRGIEQIFKRAQQAFNGWSKFEATERTTDKLLNMLDFDFFELLDSLTIARSRKHITTYYDTSEIGDFPKRNKPVSIQTPLTSDDGTDYTEIAETLTLLNLSIYSPLSYILPTRVKFYEELYERKVKSGASSFSQRDRESSLKILMRINLLKRIESSVYSFRLTIEKITQKIKGAIESLDNNEADTYSGIQDTSAADFDWDADWGDEENIIGNKIKVHISDIDKNRWKEDLEADIEILNKLRDDVIPITGDKDFKLMELKKIISEKVRTPFNSDNKKVIIFTAFADTANYLYDSLKDNIKSEFNINTALITGSKKICTTKAIPNHLNTLLTCFSPKSKNKNLTLSFIDEEIDLLIATDCISEGQNLQDCDYLINYDIHWNPVRIIQRFGRIDRIGSTNKSITMVNFWPDVTLDSYINLKQRVENKMLITTMASTGDDNILNTEEKDLEYRKIQLKKLQEEVVDLEDLRGGVSITDLGLNDFRIDLSNYINTYGELRNIPEGLHAVTNSEEGLDKGVIYILKNINSSVNIDKMNRLHPYYMIYIKDDGDVIYDHIEGKKILDILRKQCKGFDTPITDACKDFCLETDNYRAMDKYSELLQKSIGEIIKSEDEKEVTSLFSAGGTNTLNNYIKGIEDFKLISFVVVN